MHALESFNKDHSLKNIKIYPIETIICALEISLEIRVNEG